MQVYFLIISNYLTNVSKLHMIRRTINCRWAVSSVNEFKVYHFLKQLHFGQSVVHNGVVWVDCQRLTMGTLSILRYCCTAETLTENRIRCCIFCSRQLFKGSKNNFETGMATYKRTKGTKPSKVNMQSDEWRAWPTNLRLEENSLPESFDQAVQDHLWSNGKPGLSRIVQQNCSILCQKI